LNNEKNLNEKTIQELKKICKFSNNKKDCLVYSFDASEFKGKALGVAWPENPEQVKKLLKICNKYRIPITPRGGGTSLTGGSAGFNSIVIDLSKMNKIISLNKEKKVVIVEPGVVLDNLNSLLKKFDLIFPVIPASHKTCEIGGMISTNAAGERAIKYGKTIDWIKSLEVYLPNGKKIKAKNNKIKDFAGKEGLNGIITKAELRLKEKTRTRSLNFLKFEKNEEIIKKIKEIIKNKNISAIEFINPYCAELINLEAKNYLIIEYESKEGEIKSKKKIEKIWKIRESCGPVLTQKGWIIMEDPKIPLKKMNNFLNFLEKNKIPCFGHIGIGILHPRFQLNQKELVKKMFKKVKKLGGEISGEHGIGITKKEFLNKKMIENFKKMKKIYDPYNILNEGKVI